MAEAIDPKDRMKEMINDPKAFAARELDAYVTILFEIEDGDSPILRNAAFSMWSEYMKLYEEGLIKPQQDFKDIDDFIEYIKKSGAPEEVRADRDTLIRFLAAGFATFLDEVNIDSPLLRQVAYRKRRGRMPFSFDWLKTPPFKPLPEDQIVDVLRNHYVPDLPQLKQVIEKHHDTIFWELEAPKDEDGKYCCGVVLVKQGIIKPSLKMCILDSYLPKLWVETLIKRPVEVEFVDSPAVREGASSCDVRIHLRPSVYTYKTTDVF